MPRRCRRELQRQSPRFRQSRDSSGPWQSLCDGCAPWASLLLQFEREFILPTPTLVVLEGDQTGQELLAEALRVLDPRVTGLETATSSATICRSRIGARRNNGVVTEAADGDTASRIGLKAATITPERSRRRRLAQSHLARSDRRQRHRAHRTQTSARRADRAAFTRRSRSCAWRSATRTAPKSGAKATGMDEIAVPHGNDFAARLPLRLRSSRSSRPAKWAPRSSAVRSSR